MAEPQIAVTNTTVDLSVAAHNIVQLTVQNVTPTITVDSTQTILSFTNTIDAISNPTETTEIIMTNSVSQINLVNNVPNLTLSDTGIQGPKGDSGDAATTSWIKLATGWKTAPTLNTTIADGDVWNYIYEGSSGDVTYYRLVPSGTADDAFYETFSDGVLSDLIVVKEVTIV